MRPVLGARVLVATVAMVLASAVAVGAAPAQAATKTPVAGLTVTPAQATVGSTVTVAATATNTGSTGMGQVALGILTSLGPTSIVPPKNASCRGARVVNQTVYYCLLSSLGAGRTATLTLTVVPPVAGTYQFSSYARNVTTMTETGAVATLTAA